MDLQINKSDMSGAGQAAKTEPVTKNKFIPGVTKPCLCVGVLENGQTQKFDVDNPAELRENLRGFSLAWVDYRTDTLRDEAASVAASLGFNPLLPASLLQDQYASYEDFDVELGLMLPVIKVDKIEVITSPLLILIRKNFILTIHATNLTRFERLGRYAETFLKKIPMNLSTFDKLTILLIRIIDQNNEKNFEHLRYIEEEGDNISEMLSDPKTPRFQLGPQIHQMKHALITYLNTMWSTRSVLDALRYGDAELITDDLRLLARLEGLNRNVQSQIGLSEHLSEVLASGLEVLQSIYNNQLQILNNRMAMVMTYLTIIGTAVLVPNTLATIFSSTIFGLGPEDRGWYIAVLVLATILATFASYWWVRKKGWLPRKFD